VLRDEAVPPEHGPAWMGMTDDNAAAWRSERRSSERIPVEMWVEESSDRELYFQRGANISTGGLFLKRTIPHARGTIVWLRFTLPGDTAAIEVQGEIVNVGEGDADLGMGVRFVDLEADDRLRIEAFIGRVKLGGAEDHATPVAIDGGRVKTRG
jgi:uncharacterized protein (TIGR02266 family)